MSIREIPFGYIKGDKIYLKSWGSFKDREIGLIKDDEDSSIAYFESRFEDLSKKIDELDQTISEAENKGSFLMKLKHLKDSLGSHDGLGDYQSLNKKLEAREKELQALIDQNRERNTEVKKEMLQEVGEIVKIVNWRESTELIHDIKSRWIKTGNASDDENQNLDESFWQVISDFFERKKAFYEDKKRLIKSYRESYEEILEEARNLSKVVGKERFEKISQLKERWKETGNIPKEEYDQLRDQFNKLIKRPLQRPGINLNGILFKLEQYFTRSQKYDPREIERLKKEISRFRATSPEWRDVRKKALQLVSVIAERDFIERLASKRFADYSNLDQEKRRNIKMGILKELLSRDKEELAKFEENSANFNVSSGGMSQLVDKKLIQQRNKISTKERLLKHLQEGL